LSIAGLITRTTVMGGVLIVMAFSLIITQALHFYLGNQPA
jgi:hypothetical protein